jgi:hypothetical protein
MREHNGDNSNGKNHFMQGSLKCVYKRFLDLTRYRVVPRGMSFREFMEADININSSLTNVDEIMAEKEYLETTKEFSKLCIG